MSIYIYIYSSLNEDNMQPIMTGWSKIDSCEYNIEWECKGSVKLERLKLKSFNKSLKISISL